MKYFFIQIMKNKIEDYNAININNKKKKIKKNRQKKNIGLKFVQFFLNEKKIIELKFNKLDSLCYIYFNI